MNLTFISMNLLIAGVKSVFERLFLFINCPANSETRHDDLH